MITKFTEYSGCFNITLTPESEKEIVQLVRLGINKTKELRGIYVDAHQDLSFNTSIVLGKKRRVSSEVG